MGLYEVYEGLGSPSVLLALAIMFAAGYLLSRLTRLVRLPDVTGYIVSGILIGPFLLDLVPSEVISGLGFLSDLALGFIAFGVGKFFKVSTLKKTGLGSVVITLFESLAAGVFVGFGVYALFPEEGTGFALVLGAIATATAPASTLLTIRQYGAKGRFVDTLLSVVALDDVVCLLCFSAATAFVSGGSDVVSILLPIAYNLLFVAVGFAAGLLLFLFSKKKKEGLLVPTVTLILAITGSASLLGVSPLLSCMVFGAVYMNLSKSERVFDEVDSFTPPVMLLFFVYSGLSMDLSAFLDIGLVGIAYFLLRLAGKYAGSFAGAAISGSGREVRLYLGLALAPQAGVAIGLAFMGERMLPPEVGRVFLNVVLCSSVLYELMGPALAKAALFASGAIKRKASPVEAVAVPPREVVRLGEGTPSSLPAESNLASGDWRYNRGNAAYLRAKGGSGENPQAPF